MSLQNNEFRNKTAILYTRVSTEEQAKTGYSLRDQKHRLLNFCTIHNMTVLNHFEDDESAKSFDRTQFKLLREFAKEHRSKIDYLLFLKWDRFSRNVTLSYNVLAEFFKMGIIPQAVEQPVNFDIPESSYMLAFYLASPQVENDRRSLNTKMGMRRAMREGRWVSAPPKGYKMTHDESGKSIIVKSDDAKFIELAFNEMYKGIFTQKEVLKKLRANGFKLSSSQFSNALRNPLYKGKIFIPAWKDEPEELVSGIHQPIVTEDIFDAVQIIIDKKAITGKGKPVSKHPELPLRGFLTCSKCGGNLTGSSSKGNGGKYYYYHCQNKCTERFRADTANSKFNKFLSDISIPEEVSNLYQKVLLDVFQDREKDRYNSIKKIESDISSYQDKLLKADEKLVEEVIDKEAYQRLKISYTSKINELNTNKYDLEITESNFEKYLKFGFTLISNLGDYYNEASFSIKQKMIGLIFPEKLIYQDETYRTKRLHPVIELIISKKAQIHQNKKGLTSNDANQSYEAPRVGFEPTTDRLTADCSATELPRKIFFVSEER